MGFRESHKHPGHKVGIDMVVDLLVLNNISIKITRGKKVALVGESGSGKTTISKLLLKYYTPEEGKININLRK